MEGRRAGHWNVVGHEWALEFIQGALARDRLAHAYLFLGPAHVGKRTVALELARAINCTGEQRPCGTCRSCRLAHAGSHPAITTVRGMGSHGAFLVEQVRDLRRDANLTVLEGKWRVFILCGMEMSNESASNALLKILEEPPARVIWILTATSSELVPATIISRCQVLWLRPTGRQLIESALVEQWGIPIEKAALCARLSGGRMGKALELSQNEGALAKTKEILEQHLQLLRAGLVERFAAAALLSRRPEEIHPLLEVWATWWHDILLSKAGLESSCTYTDRSEERRAAASQYAHSDIFHALSGLQSCADHIDKNVNARLAMEQLMLRLPSAGG